MKKDSPQSFEEMTIKGLESSLSGLEMLAHECADCGEALGTSPNAETMKRLADLAEHLNDFNIFQAQVCNVFEIDSEDLRNDNGSLNAVREKYCGSLSELLVKLEQHDLKGVADILQCNIKESLDSYRDFLPAMKEFIEKEYAPQPIHN